MYVMNDDIGVESLCDVGIAAHTDFDHKIEEGEDVPHVGDQGCAMDGFSGDHDLSEKSEISA